MRLPPAIRAVSLQPVGRCDDEPSAALRLAASDKRGTTRIMRSIRLGHLQDDRLIRADRTAVLRPDVESHRQAGLTLDQA